MASVLALAAVLGITSHLGFFVHGERDIQSTYILSTFVLGPFLLLTWELISGNSKFGTEAVEITFMASSTYFAVLTFSILSYRVFFHSLRHFPGPLSARLSKLTRFARLLPRSDNFAQIHQLHQKYGDIVRVGPNELTIINPNAIALIHGSNSNCIKSVWYDAIGGSNPSLQLIRSRAAHDKRRKVWDQAFSTKALRNYEGRVTKSVDELIARLDNFDGQPVNATRWMQYYGFDLMGDLAFGESFNMLQSGENHVALKFLQDGMHFVGILSSIPWITQILLAIPGAANGSKIFTKFTEDQAEKRRNNPPVLPDITSWLIDAEENSQAPVQWNRQWLYGDTGLLVVAGSDTTSATITHLMYHLAQDPALATRLRQELDTTSPGDSKFLAALINETLRLHPPTPSGVPRKTPPDGLMIGDTFIPGGVVVTIPLYSLGRLESAFPKATEFIPERWTTSPELVKNRAAFMPFSTGPYSCVGKQLALLSLRTAVSRLVQHFDIGFAPGETGEVLLRDTRDVFTLELAPLNLVFKRRE